MSSGQQRAYEDGSMCGTRAWTDRVARLEVGGSEITEMPQDLGDWGRGRAFCRQYRRQRDCSLGLCGSGPANILDSYVALTIIRAEEVHEYSFQGRLADGDMA